jgi:hypothetical protein
MVTERASCEVQVASISQLTVSLLSRQCGILNISLPYRPPRPVTRTSLHVLNVRLRGVVHKDSCICLWNPYCKNVFGTTLLGLSLSVVNINVVLSGRQLGWRIFPPGHDPIVPWSWKGYGTHYSALNMSAPVRVAWFISMMERTTPLWSSFA